MIDELKQWEYDKGYEKGKADTLKVIEDIKAEIEQMNNIDYVEPVTVDEVLQIIDKHISAHWTVIDPKWGGGVACGHCGRCFDEMEPFCGSCGRRMFYPVKKEGKT